jgi:uncharacterized protein (DUF305 family)
MKTVKGLGLPGLLLAVLLLLASCGGATGGGAAGGGQGDGGMQGMDHGSMDGGNKNNGGMEGMDHGSMGSMGGEKMARKMVSPDGEYSDKAFIDAMVPHHEGAVDMAKVALENAQHQEIKSLARDIVGAQEAEIKQLGEIREREFGSAESPSGMSEMDMQMMGMTDPQKLAKQEPFDRAFIDAMIPHHESAISMANVALEESENGEILGIAEDIVDAQKREIAQMRSWRQQWYPEG